MIKSRKLVSVPGSRLLMRQLIWGGADMVFSHCGLFFGPWPGIYTPGTVITIPVIDHRIVNDRPVNIGVTDHPGIYIHYGCIIPEGAALPHAPAESHAAIAVTVINSSVITDVRSPVTGMPAVITAFISPITGRPKVSNLRRHHPDTRYPVVSIIPIGPITRVPNIPIVWTGWLDIYRKRRWGYAGMYADSNADLCLGMDAESRKQDKAKCGNF